jgi:hypothetical protein
MVKYPDKEVLKRRKLRFLGWLEMLSRKEKYMLRNIAVKQISRDFTNKTGKVIDVVEQMFWLREELLSSVSGKYKTLAEFFTKKNKELK